MIQIWIHTKPRMIDFAPAACEMRSGRGLSTIDLCASFENTNYRPKQVQGGLEDRLETGRKI